MVMLAIGAGAMSTFFLLTRTNVGQAIVLEAALRRVEGAVNGEIVVSGIRSTGLHRGAKLVGVRVNAPDGSPLLAADSLEAEYSVRDILRGDILLAGVESAYPNGNVPNWRSRRGGTPDRSQPPVGSFAALKLHLSHPNREALATAWPIPDEPPVTTML